jgi:hypothetical protein
MSSTERPEADVAEQSRSVTDEGFDRAFDAMIDQGPGVELDAAIGDVLDQLHEAGLPDEDEAPYAG